MHSIVPPTSDAQVHPTPRAYLHEHDFAGCIECGCQHSPPAAKTGPICTCPDTGRADLPESCPTPGCDGDTRYAAPGRGHVTGCTYPMNLTNAHAGLCKAVETAERVFGWQHLVRYSGMSDEWMRATLTAIVEASLATRPGRGEREAPDRCGCPTNECGDIRCHNCGEMVNVRCWNCKTPRGEGICANPTTLSSTDDKCDHDWLDRPESDTRECLICGIEVNG